MDRILAIQAFIRVVETGSFVRAAEKLDLSTTSTSRLVGELETRLGTRLLHRTTRRLNLTDEGSRFFDRASQILADLDDAEAEVGANVHTPSGRLRLSVPMSFGVRHLSPLLSKYRALYPDVHLEVSVADRIADLVEEGFDLALRITRRLQPGHHVARRLGSIRLVVCASPNYLSKYGVPASPEDLSAHNCLTQLNSVYSERWNFEGAKGEIAVPVRGTFRADNGDMMRMAALAGEGIILEPTFIVGDDLARGDLVPLLLDWPVPHAEALAVYPSRRHLSAKVRTFLDFLQREFKEDPSWDAWLHGQKSLAKASGKRRRQKPET
jgi:DNA-binding transcriptional LysR family regulator